MNKESNEKNKAAKLKGETMNKREQKKLEEELQLRKGLGRGGHANFRYRNNLRIKELEEMLRK